MKGKAKEDFEKWYNNKPIFEIESLHYFYKYSDSLQWGVIVNFFDSVGLNIEILVSPIAHTQSSRRFDYTIFKNNEEIDWSTFDFETRQEARTKAIEKATEIYNERK